MKRIPRSILPSLAACALAATAHAAGFTNTFDTGPLDGDWSQQVTWSAGPAGYAGGGCLRSTATTGGWTFSSGGGPKCDFNSARRAEIASLIQTGNGRLGFDIVVDGTSFNANAQWWQVNVAASSPGGGWQLMANVVDADQSAGNTALRIYHYETNFTALGWTDPGSASFQLFFGANSAANNPIHYYLDNVRVFASGTNTVARAPSVFVHPGAWDSKAELDFVKAQIQAGAQPWTAEFNRLTNSSYATRTPNGKATINSNGGDADLSAADAIAAYTQALLWYHSGDATYASRAVAILNSWTNLQSFTAGSDQDKLQAGWIGAVFAPAAEIVRGYAGWNTNDMANLRAMFRRAFYPQLNTMSTWNGNVDLTQIDAMMAIAVFNEDTNEFNLGLTRFAARIPSYFYLSSAGTPPPIAGDGGNVPNFWYNPTLLTNGLTQETCRDNGHHTQFAIGSALHAAETAWHQGVDIYTPNTDRFTYAMELLATQFLTGSMQNTCGNNTPTADRYDTWEVGYNHYHNRAGLVLTNTGQLILNQIRPTASRADWNLVYETLTHADLPGNLSSPGAVLPPILSAGSILGNGAFQFTFSNNSAASFTVLSTTNLASTNWSVFGVPSNTGAGILQFTTPPITNDPQRFFRVRSP